MDKQTEITVSRLATYEFNVGGFGDVVETACSGLFIVASVAEYTSYY